jgi:hypothetical protein
MDMISEKELRPSQLLVCFAVGVRRNDATSERRLRLGDRLDVRLLEQGRNDAISERGLRLELLFSIATVNTGDRVHREPG